MNGIVHNCTHGDDKLEKRIPDEVIFTKIMAYIDHIFHTLRPQKLLYMAIDGLSLLLLPEAVLFWEAVVATCCIQGPQHAAWWPS